MIYFYPKDDTAGCTREALDFTAAARKFEAAGVLVLGVSKDSLESHEKFRRKHKLKVALASDPDIEAARAWGVWGEKTPLWPQIQGDRARHLLGRRPGPHRGGLAQGEGSGTCGGRARRGKAALKKRREPNRQAGLRFGPRLTAGSFFWKRRLIAVQQAGEMPAQVGRARKKPLKDHSQMTETLLQRVWTWLHETFPERQIYIRSDGRVQFFTFGPSLQASWPA